MLRINQSPPPTKSTSFFFLNRVDVNISRNLTPPSPPFYNWFFGIFWLILCFVHLLRTISPSPLSLAQVFSKGEGEGGLTLKILVGQVYASKYAVTALSFQGVCRPPIVTKSKKVFFFKANIIIPEQLIKSLT